MQRLPMYPMVSDPKSEVVSGFQSEAQHVAGCVSKPWRWAELRLFAVSRALGEFCASSHGLIRSAASASMFGPGAWAGRRPIGRCRQQQNGDSERDGLSRSKVCCWPAKQLARQLPETLQINHSSENVRSPGLLRRNCCEGTRTERACTASL